MFDDRIEAFLTDPLWPLLAASVMLLSLAALGRVLFLARRMLGAAADEGDRQGDSSTR